MLRVEFDGPFGPCIRLIRGKRFLALSLNVWQKLRVNIPFLRTSGYNIKLTDNKEVTVVQFHDRRYVSFHNTYQRQGIVHSVYINLNDDEWHTFLVALDTVDVMFPPKPIASCPSCANFKQVVSLVDGRMCKSQLTPDALQGVLENNAMSYNQEMLCCEYCGGSTNTYDSGCHCHAFHCRDCEPGNFCDTCGTLKVFGI